MFTRRPAVHAALLVPRRVSPSPPVQATTAPVNLGGPDSGEYAGTVPGFPPEVKSPNALLWPPAPGQPVRRDGTVTGRGGRTVIPPPLHPPHSNRSGRPSFPLGTRNSSPHCWQRISVSARVPSLMSVRGISPAPTPHRPSGLGESTLGRVLMEVAHEIETAAAQFPFTARLAAAKPVPYGGSTRCGDP